MSDSSSTKPKTFERITALIPHTPIGFFNDWNSLPQSIKSEIDEFVTSIRKHFRDFTEKKFVVVYNGEDDSWTRNINDSLRILGICALDVNKLDHSDDEVFFKDQIISFSKTCPNAHIVIISGDSNCCKNILTNENLRKDQVYLIHNLSDLEEDSVLLQLPKESIHFNHFKPELNTATPFHDQFHQIRAPKSGTPLVVLVDIENRIPPKCFDKLPNLINDHLEGFDLKEFIIAISETNYAGLSDQARDKLRNIQGCRVVCAEGKKNAADRRLIKEGMDAYEKYPDAHFAVVTSDSDFCNFIVDLVYYKNRVVYLLHQITGNKKGKDQRCLIPSASQAIFFWLKKKVPFSTAMVQLPPRDDASTSNSGKAYNDDPYFQK